MERRRQSSGALGLSVAAASIASLAALGGCDLSYLTADLTSGSAGSTTGSGTGAAGSGAGGTAGSGAGGTGGTTTSTGASSSSSSTGGAEPTALQGSVAFGDPAQNDDILLAGGNIRVQGLSDGSALVAFHAYGSNIKVPGGMTFAADASKSATDPDLFIARVAANGKLVKAVQFSMPGAQTFLALVSAGINGPHYLAGRTFSPIVLPKLGAGVNINPSSADSFVLMLDGNLAPTAVATFAGAGNQNLESLVLDPQGDVWVGGQLATALDVRGVGPAGGPDASLGCMPATYTPLKNEYAGFVAHLKGDLSSCKSAFVFGPTAQPKVVNTEVLGVAVDDAGSLFVAGRFGGTMSVGAAPVMNTAYNAGFVAKIAADGKHWSAVLDSNAGDNRVWAMALAPDSVVAGGVTSTGPLFASTVAGGMPLSGPCVPTDKAGSEDAMLVGLDLATGGCKWGVRLSSGQNAPVTEEKIRAVAVEGNGRVWATGTFDKILAVTGTGQPAGLDNGARWESFALRFDAGGSVKTPWAQAWSGPGDQVARDVSLLPNGRVAIVGSYTGTIPGGAPTLPSAADDPHDYFLLFLDPKYPPELF
jgi:hypothetical protein